MVHSLACIQHLDIDDITKKCKKQTSIIQTIKGENNENYDSRRSEPPELSRLNHRIRVLNDSMKKMEYLCFNKKHLTDVLLWSSNVDNYSICEMMTIAGIMVEFNENEVCGMLCEFRAWRILPCAMSLHSRLGKNSLLGLLGQDLIIRYLSHS